jgi:curved DNA-binding protein CbpA
MFLAYTYCQDEDGKSRDDSHYYDIYEAIDTLTKLTPHRTFYELLGVSPDAPDEVVGRAFRRTSVMYHPDKLRVQGKSDERTERLSKLVQAVGSLLRTEKGRRDYDWVLNEAPAWHRQSVYVLRKLVPTTKVSVRQVIIIVLSFSVGLQLIWHWCSYAAAWYMILSSRWSVRSMGKKEVERMRKRNINADPTFVAMNNSTYHTVMLADSPPPPIPNPLKLWIFQLPLFLTKPLINLLRFGRKNANKKTN